MQVERITSRGQLIPLHFFDENLADALTDSQMKLLSTAATAGDFSGDEYGPMPFPGEIVAICAGSNADYTAGTAVFGPTIDGTEKTALQVTLDDTNQRARKVVARDTIAFEAGARIGCEVTTASLAPATTDVVVTVWVLAYLEGI